ncbi:DUF1971 domain-containing protein [Sphingomonas qilianensis]|uniref:DUF1971 domain-containing protein n=1 Tax=Sphingomonas qilianensis TaxID=1736690 RepID=A0ABU9XTH7_9SPHN
MNAASPPFPGGMQRYKRTPLFSEETVPVGLRRDHATKDGTWGLIEVESGRLLYSITDPRRLPTERVLTPDDPPGVIEPTILHHVTPVGPVSFYVSFWR